MLTPGLSLPILLYPLDKNCSLEKVMSELRLQERSLRWLSRNVGVHYMTVINWKKNGVPRWHHDQVAKILNKDVGDLF